MMIKAVIFDMDGTVLDTLQDIQAAVNHALRVQGLSPKSLSDIRQAVGNGARRLIERIVPANYTEAQILEVFQTYQTYYDQHNNVHTKPYDGILEMLDALKQKGMLLGVVSNKFDYLVKELNVHVFQERFDVAVGEKPGIPIKPEPDMVLNALNELGINPDEAIYVGDSEVDMQTAKNAGLYAVGVTWGFREEALLRQYHADAIITHPSELLELITTLSKNLSLLK